MPTVLITGANRGIGLELCRQLSQRGDEVIATCRQPSAGLETLGVRVQRGVDVNDEASLRSLAGALAGTKLDLLVNNAGILTRESLEDLDFERIRRQFEVNTLGPLRVSSALLQNLGAGSKIAIITSLMGSMADNASGGVYGYRMSKAAVNMAAVSLARDLRARGITVLILHPGRVATRMTGNEGTPVAQAARGLIARMDELGIDSTGTFWHADGRRLPW